MIPRCCAATLQCRAWATRRRPYTSLPCAPPTRFSSLHVHRSETETCAALSVHEALDAEARSCSVSWICVEASEAAPRFFLRRNSCVLARGEVLIAGAAIHDFAMEKVLSRSRDIGCERVSFHLLLR
jgi:hypothetical protein